MSRKYFTNTNDDENGTENWSYPAGFERFNSANIPKSRLGRRRTINPFVEAKKSILNIVSSDRQKLENDTKDDLKDIASKTTSLTHPVNSFLTPNYKKIDHTADRNSEEYDENRVCDNNFGHFTPFRSVSSYPLQEVNNILNDQNQILSSEKPGNITYSMKIQQDQQPEVKKILNKSFEAEETVNSSGECTQLYCSTTINGPTHSDSSHSDLCNNSSFMTAHEYNFEKNRSHHDFLKTPGKGYGLFDMVASPLDSLSMRSDDDTDSLHKFLVKTPALRCYDPLHTPYRSQIKHDLYTPLKKKSSTPGHKNLDNVPEREMEYEESNNYGLISISQSGGGIKNGYIVGSDKISCNGGSFEKPGDSILGMEYDSTPLATANKYKTKSTVELNKQPPSVEKFVKRQIFEGLGWTIPHASYSIKSPVKEIPPTIVQNSEMEMKNTLIQPILPKTESNIQPKLDILHKPLFLNKSDVDCVAVSQSLKHSPIKMEEPTPVSVSDEKSLKKENERLFCKREESTFRPLNISEEPKKHDLPIQEEITDAISLSSSTYPSKTVKILTNDMKLSVPSLKHSFSSDKLKDSSSRNGLPSEKERTIVMQPLEVQKKETNEKMECNDTVILKQSNPQNLIEEKQVEEKVQIKSVQGCCVNETPMFGCQRQMIKPPQANLIYVNQKPYTVLSMLGRGGSSEVYQVLDAKSSKLMALKFVNLSSVEEAVAKGYLNEIEVLSKLQCCPSVIKMFDNEYISESKILYVLMEKGDIDFSRLMKDITKTKKISMPMIVYYWTEMLNAVKDIHDKGIIHSDLKPANFLLVSGRLKLIDFGIASALQGDMTSVLKDITTGTFNYMSPEAIRNSGETKGYKINYKSDIWSLGCILYNLLFGRTPFSHLTNTWTKLQAIADPETTVSFPTGSVAPPHLLLSVRWALTKDPKERPTAEELLRLAELTPGPETQLGRQITSLLGEYVLQMFPNCRVRFEIENPKDKKQTNNLHH